MYSIFKCLFSLEPMAKAEVSKYGSDTESSGMGLLS